MEVMQRIATGAQLETREVPADPSWAAIAPGIGYPASLSAHAAENLSAVLACAHVIATSLANAHGILALDQAARGG